MLKLKSREDITDKIDQGGMVLLYFGSKNCGVCVDLKPKIEAMLKDYPEIEAYHVDIERSPNLAINYNIFTIPGILLFIEGKENIREARHISVRDLERKINRYYKLFFG